MTNETGDNKQWDNKKWDFVEPHLSKFTFEKIDTLPRVLISVDGDYNVTFADDLTLDEAKELLRRWAIMGAKITKAQAESFGPYVQEI